MSMTLTEAIQREQEMAKSDCSREHEQLADWLKELKEFREQNTDKHKNKTKYDYGTFEQDTIMELYRSKLKELREKYNLSDEDVSYLLARADTYTYFEYKHNGWTYEGGCDRYTGCKNLTYYILFTHYLEIAAKEYWG